MTHTYTNFWSEHSPLVNNDEAYSSSGLLVLFHWINLLEIHAVPVCKKCDWEYNMKAEFKSSEIIDLF